MLKLSLTCLLIVMVTVMLPGCALITGETENELPSQAPISTEFGRMLGLVTYSFLENYDIFFGNLGQAKELYGVEDSDSYEAIKQLPEEEQRQFAYTWSAAASAYPYWNRPDLAPLIGFDAYSFNRVVVINNMPPRISCIAEGNLDEELIAGKLIEQGYIKTDYGSYSYYGIRDDFEMDIMNPLCQVVLGAMNRVAVLDDILIISPFTEVVTSTLDAMADNTPSIIDNAVCRALADSLGDPLAAMMTTPERIISSISEDKGRPAFDFIIPDSWGQLHTYDMACLGYRAEGDKRFFDISLYYADKKTAEADGAEIINRMQSYTLNTWIENLDNIAFTDMYVPDEPVVKQYAEGAVLKISCQLIPEGRRGVLMLMGESGMPFHDLLFLALDPAQYIVK
jgi:hypothetical protein